MAGIGMARFWKIMKGHHTHIAHHCTRHTTCPGTVTGTVFGTVTVTGPTRPDTTEQGLATTTGTTLDTHAPPIISGM
eukprot:m.30131 g.30131  ORF g.30131 m.30131 type:complete len:77 (+) comp12193_c0_seq1:1106-1336(+)